MGLNNAKKKSTYKSETTVHVAFVGRGTGQVLSAKRKKDVNWSPKATVSKYINKYLPKTKPGKLPVQGTLEYPGNIAVTPVRKSIYEANKKELAIVDDPKDPQTYIDLCKKYFGFDFEYDSEIGIYRGIKPEPPKEEGDVPEGDVPEGDGEPDPLNS